MKEKGFGSGYFCHFEQSESSYVSIRLEAEATKSFTIVQDDRLEFSLNYQLQ